MGSKCFVLLLVVIKHLISVLVLILRPLEIVIVLQLTIKVLSTHTSTGWVLQANHACFRILGAIWDPSGKEETYSLDVIQRRAARWARGAYGVVSVTALLCDLGWLSLADRRQNQRLCLFYKILYSALDIPPGSMNITRHTGHTIRGSHLWKLNRVSASDRHQGWGQIRFIKYKYKYIFFRVSNTNTKTNTPEKIWSNTNTNTAHQIQIQIHTEADTKLPPFYRWHIQINFIVRKLFYLFKFHWKLFPKVQSTMSLHWFRKWLGIALSRQQAIIWPMMAQFTDA